MKSALIKQFVKKAVVKTIIFTIFMAIITSVAQSMSPMVSNELALSQMQNSNAMHILMNSYNKLRPIVNFAYIGIVTLFVYTLGRDTYKFVKTINTSENNMEEN